MEGLDFGALGKARPAFGACDPGETWACQQNPSDLGLASDIGTRSERAKGAQFLTLASCQPGQRAISAATSYVETGLGQHPRFGQPRQFTTVHRLGS